MDFVTIKKGEKVLVVTKRQYEIIYKDYGFVITGEAEEPITPEYVNPIGHTTFHDADEFNADDPLSEYANTVTLTSDTESKSTETEKKGATGRKTAKKDV